MVLRQFAVILQCLILLSLRSGSASAQEPAPATKEAWVEKLSHMTIQDLNQRQITRQFAALDPDFAYAVFREAWPRLNNTSLRYGLVESFLIGNIKYNGVEKPAYQPNPHLLDIMATALEETPDTTADKIRAGRAIAKEYVLHELLGIAFQEVSGPDDFKKWRDSTANRPLATVIQEGSRRVVNTLETGSVDQRLKTLELLRKINYYTGSSTDIRNGVTTHGHDAAGMMNVRRNALLDAKLPDALGNLLGPDNPEQVRQDSVYVLARLQPGDEALRKYERDFQRELPRMLEQPADPAENANPFRLRVRLSDLLGAFGGDWAVDTLVSLLRKSQESGKPDYSLVSAVQYCDNPRVIPALIGLMSSDNTGMGRDPFESALLRIAGLNTFTDRGGHDLLWWRLWWHDYKKRFPPEIQNLPIQLPHRSGVSATDAAVAPVSRPRVERAFISQDPKRSYWMISPVSAKANPLTERDRSAIANSGLRKLASVPPYRPGLLVLLLDQDTAAADGLDSWLDLSDALAGRYWLAIAIRPSWRGSAAADRWPTRQDTLATHGTALATETFVEQIVGQMQANAAIDPARIFLVAEGNSGVAGYSCALQKATPFKGFCFLSAPFRSVLLPPASSAKSRKFYLAIGLEHSGATDALAEAAAPILKQHGAVVLADRLKGATMLEGLQHGVRWLER